MDPLNGSSYGDNDHNLPAFTGAAAFGLPARYCLTSWATKARSRGQKELE